MAMTNESFESEKDYVLKGVHPKLAEALWSVAYDRGHPSGHEEVRGMLKGLVAQFGEVNRLMNLYVDYKENPCASSVSVSS